MAETITIRLRGIVWDTPDGSLILTVLGDRKRRRLVLPWIPDELERSGFARAWEQVPRPGLDPLAYDTGGNLRTATFTVRLNTPDLDQPVSGLINHLEDAAETGAHIEATLGPRILGLCHITGLTIRETDWDAAANPVDAVAEIELTENSDAPRAVGPVTRIRGTGRNMAARRPRR